VPSSKAIWVQTGVAVSCAQSLRTSPGRPAPPPGSCNAGEQQPDEQKRIHGYHADGEEDHRGSHVERVSENAVWPPGKWGVRRSDDKNAECCQKNGQARHRQDQPRIESSFQRGKGGPYGCKHEWLGHDRSAHRAETFPGVIAGHVGHSPRHIFPGNAHIQHGQRQRLHEPPGVIHTRMEYWRHINGKAGIILRLFFPVHGVGRKGGETDRDIFRARW